MRRIGTLRRTHLERHPIELALFVTLGAALAFGALLGVAWAAGFYDVADRLRGAHDSTLWFPIALGAETVAYIGYVFAYREIARVEGGAKLPAGRLAALVSAGFGVFVARGGFAVDRHALEHAGVPPRDARVRVLGLGALEYAVLAPAASICAIVLLVEGAKKPNEGFTMPWAIAVPLGFVFAVWAIRHRGRFRSKRGWRSVVSHALDAVHVLRCLATAPRKHGAAFVGTAVYWCGDIACLWACLQAFGASPTVPALIVGYATGYALTRRTLPLAGAGVVESLLPFALAWAGIGLAPAVLAVFAYRVFNFWLPLIPAAIGLRTARRMAEERENLARAA